MELENLNFVYAKYRRTLFDAEFTVAFDSYRMIVEQEKVYYNDYVFMCP